MNVLALCAGVGGLELGVDLATGGNARTVCYVEREVYAAAVLAKRMEEGCLASAPIWSDLGTFDGKPWRGVVDCITSGIPCQPYSVAGKQRGHDDERALWPELVRIVAECRPSLVFVENVPTFARWFREPGEALCRLGYDLAEPVFLAASDVGASHERERVFFLAYAERSRREGWLGRHEYPGGEPETRGVQVADALRLDAMEAAPSRCIGARGLAAEPGGKVETWPPGPGELDLWRRVLARAPHLEPAVRRVADGVPHRMDRLRALGNGVVPRVAAEAFRELVKKAKR